MVVWATDVFIGGEHEAPVGELLLAFGLSGGGSELF